MPVTAYPHIEHSADGVLYIQGTKIKVIEVALDRIAHNWDADEMQRQHPELKLAQIHAALTYYYDHQADLDRRIAEQLLLVDELREKWSSPRLVARLRAARAGS